MTRPAKDGRTAGPWIATERHANYPGWVLLYNTEHGTRRVDKIKDGTFCKADAEFIVEACNAHDSLRASNARLREALARCVLVFTPLSGVVTGGQVTLEDARAALAGDGEGGGR